MFILIPLLSGIYFSENILINVHTRRCLALRFWAVVHATRGVYITMGQSRQGVTRNMASKTSVIGFYSWLYIKKD